jgi:hypothetical protein
MLTLFQVFGRKEAHLCFGDFNFSFILALNKD